MTDDNNFPFPHLLFAADATNLFLKQNGGEVIKAMQPQLEKKIAVEFQRIANNLIDKVPVNDFYKD